MKIIQHMKRWGLSLLELLVVLSILVATTNPNLAAPGGLSSFPDISGQVAAISQGPSDELGVYQAPGGDGGDGGTGGNGVAAVF